MFTVRVFVACLFGLLPGVCLAADQAPTGKYELRTSLNDTFTVVEPAGWRLKVEKMLPLKYTNILITPRRRAGFSMMLYFKCDTPGVGLYNSPAKIERWVVESSKKEFPLVVERTIRPRRFDAQGWYGCYAVLTELRWAKANAIPRGQFKYITHGMVRVSPDSVLGFTILTNETSGADYEQLLDYIRAFAKEGFVETR